jgi:short-subunit dehydrogenase
MATAIVTGSSKGIGKAVALKLLQLCYDVVGISRSTSDIQHIKFSEMLCDLTDEKQTTKIVSLLQKDAKVVMLCNIAGFGIFKPHEEIKPEIIYKMIALNLSAPIILTQALLRQLKQNHGKVFNITSVEALRSSKFSALYSATKSGLKAFGSALFEEVRKSGVGIINIHPDITDSSFFDTLQFCPSDAHDARLQPQDIADTIEHILKLRDGVAVTDITIRPQKFTIVKKPL